MEEKKRSEGEREGKGQREGKGDGTEGEEERWRRGKEITPKEGQ